MNSMHVLIFLLIGLLAAADAHDDAKYISYEALQTYKTTGRTLLQAKKKCPIDFENKNYTVITSQCKGPQYPADKCCTAFKEFVCPFAEEFNGVTENDCAVVVFSYINLYGKFPPGLFSSKCKEGKEGLDCESVKSSTLHASSHHPATLPSSISTVLMILLVFNVNVLWF